MGLNIAALNNAKEDLKKRGGSKMWIQSSKIEDPIDVRIMDPLPQMNGIYYIEVPLWWVDGVRVISPRLFGKGERDVIQVAIDEAKSSNDPDLSKLLNAVNEHKMAKIQYKSEFWIPVAKFNWVSVSNVIQGITGQDGKIDPELVGNYVEDGKWKILVTGVTLLQAINEIATKRNGHLMTERLTGFNLIISKTGEQRKTKYFAQKDEVYPMPAKMYDPANMLDPFELAQSMMVTDEYADMVIGKYLYGEELPESPEGYFLYPELREKFKNSFSDETTEPEKPAQRQRPGRGTPAAAAPTPAPAPAAPAPAPVAPAPNPAPTPRDRRAPATPAAPAAPAGRRPQRNLSQDLQNV
jgi:hypothetical protein